MNDKLTKHYVAIDSLKGIIMLFIVLFHINATSVFDGAFNKYLYPIYQYGGAFGNYFFFMISGYLLSNSTKAKIQKKAIGIWRIYKTKVYKNISFVRNIFFNLFSSFNQARWPNQLANYIAEFLNDLTWLGTKCYSL